MSVLTRPIRAEITMYETLLRPHDVHQLPPLPTVEEISDKLKKAEVKREEKRLKQVEASRRAREAAESDSELYNLLAPNNHHRVDQRCIQYSPHRFPCIGNTDL